MEGSILNAYFGGHAVAAGRHREFAMASGEMSEAKFRSFLADTLGAAARVSRDGLSASIIFGVTPDRGPRGAVGMSQACHVWTAPGWREESSRCRLGRCGHVFGLELRFS
jgi:hypothetical protein